MLIVCQVMTREARNWEVHVTSHLQEQLLEPLNN